MSASTDPETGLSKDAANQILRNCQKRTVDPTELAAWVPNAVVRALKPSEDAPCHEWKEFTRELETAGFIHPGRRGR